MSDEPNDRGPVAALVWILLFLVVMGLAWINVYLRLWF